LKNQLLKRNHHSFIYWLKIPVISDLKKEKRVELFGRLKMMIDNLQTPNIKPI